MPEKLKLQPDELDQAFQKFLDSGDHLAVTTVQSMMKLAWLDGCRWAASKVGDAASAAIDKEKGANDGTSGI